MKMIANTETSDYNCGGYALGTKQWLRFTGCTREHYENDNVKPQMMNMVVELLDRYPKLKLVDEKYVRDVKHKQETIVAFRLSISDFHFCVRRHGRWTAKRGSNCIFRMTKKEVMDCEWEGYPTNYDSPIVYFAYN